MLAKIPKLTSLFARQSTSAQLTVENGSGAARVRPSQPATHPQISPLAGGAPSSSPTTTPHASADTKQIKAHLKQYLLAVAATGCSDATLRNYKSDINQFCDFVPDLQLSDFGNKPKLLAFAHSQRDKGLKEASIKRKLVSLTQFKIWLKQQGLLKSEVPLTSDSSSPADNEALQVINKQAVGSTKPSQSPDKQTRTPLRPPTSRLTLLLNLLALVMLLAGLGYFGYQQFGQAIISMAYPSVPIPPSRILSYQGRLTNTAQTPISAPINMLYKLFDADTGGTELWSSNTCSIDPDQDGIFVANLGAGAGAGSDDENCGGTIPDNVFTENSNVWLEVTVASETLTPRQPIRTVAYAINAETVQGLRPSEVATNSTILMMNQSGEVVLGTANPVIKTDPSSTGLTIESQQITIQTSAGSDGDIVLAPDGTGSVDIQGNLNVSGTSTLVGNTYITSPNTLIINSIALGESTSPTSSGAYLVGVNDEFTHSNSNNVQAVLKDLDTAIGGAGTPAWSALTAPTANLSLNHGTYTTAFDWATGTGANNLFSLTTAASSNGTGSLLNVQTGTSSTVNPLRVRAGSTEALFVNSSGNVGVGTTSPGTNMHIFNGVSGHSPTNVNGLFVENAGVSNSYYVFQTATVGGGKSFSITNAGNVGIGTTAPTNLLTLGATNSIISTDTNDGTDNKRLQLAGGGGNLNNRGAYINIMGNEYSGQEGDLSLLAGNSGVANKGAIRFFTGNAVQRMTIDSSGNVGIGTTNPSGKMHILGDGGDALVIERNSTDIINGRTLGEIDFRGIDSGTYTNQTGASIIAEGEGTWDGLTQYANPTSLKFFTQDSTGTNSLATARMVINSSGFVGINNIAPSERLDVTGNIRFSGALMPNNDPGTSGYFLTSAGAGVAPTWTSTVPASSVPFSGITSGTNTTAAMMVGAGSSLNYTSTGTINASSLEGLRGVTIAQSLRAQSNLTGGGTIAVDGSYNFSWTSRFIAISNGRGSHFSTGGYFDVLMPAAGTALTGVGGAASTTWTASGVTLGSWQALYYILPIGSGQSSLAANFRLASYTSDLEVPANWILLAVRNGDNNQVRIGSGLTLHANQSYINNTFSSAYVPNSARLLGGTWAIPGTIGSTTANTGRFTTLEATNTGNALTLSGNGANIAFSNTGGTVNQITTAGNSHLALMPNGTGNVGIGTTTPTHKLDVAGSIRAGSGGYLFTNQSANSYTTADHGRLEWGAFDYYNNELAFQTPTSLEYYDGSNWVTWATDDWKLALDNNPNTIFNVPANRNVFRFTFSGFAHRPGIMAIKLSDYSGLIPSIDYTVETSADGVNWTVDASQSNSAQRHFSLISIPHPGAATYRRVTITATAPHSGESRIRLTELGFYRLGQSLSADRMLFNWDWNRNVNFNGNINFSGALMPGGSAGTSGQFLISQGAGNAPTWSTTAPSGSVSWSGLAAPIANLSLNHGTHTTTFDWATSTGTSNLFSLTTAASSNGTGSLLNVQTGTSSTVSPLRVRAGTAEALFVDSSGNVGVGTTSPREALEIQKAFASSPTANIRLSLSGAGIVGGGGKIQFDTSQISTSTEYMASIEGIRTASGDGSSALTFKTTNVSTNASAMERMRIDQSGNVGIGTTTPSARLEVSTAQNTTAAEFTSPFIRLNPSATTNTTGFTGVSYGISTVDNYGWTVGARRTTTDGNSHAFVFNSHVNNAQGTERMRITHDGNVGIGTTNPEARLHINNSAAATIAQIIRGAASQTANLTQWQNSSGTMLAAVTASGDMVAEKFIDRTNDLYYLDPADGATALNIAGAARIAGNIRAGDNNTPNYRLHLTAGTTEAAGIGFGDDVVLYRSAANVLALASGDSFNLVSGNLQIGGTNTITSGRLFYAASGSAAAPAFSFSDSPTTGMYRAGTDILGFSTAGSARMTILAGGNVGIGTTNPGTLLHVAGTSTSNLSAAILQNLSTASNTTKSVSLDFRGTDTVGTAKNVAQVLAVPEDVHWISAGLALHTRLSDGAPAERMRITSTGNVGIGTTNPRSTLNLNGGFAIGTESAISNTHGSRRSIQIATDTNYGGIHDNHSGTLLYSTMPGGWGTAQLHISPSNDWGGYDTTPAMTIGRNVGIGTTSPGATLDVNGRIRLVNSQTELYHENNRLRVRSNNVDNVAQFANYGLFLPLTGQTYNLYTGGSIKAGYSEHATLDISTTVRLNSNGNSYLTGGNVGIGTASPNAKLSIYRAPDNTAGNTSLGFNYNGSQELWGFRMNTSSFNLHLDRHWNSWISTPAVTFERQYGRVGLSTTTPSVNLHVNDSTSYSITGPFSGAGVNSSWGTGHGTQSQWVSILASGAVVGAGIFSASDERLKENITALDLAMVDDFLDNIDPVSFVWSATDSYDTGFIAQDLMRKGFQYLVSGTPNPNLTERVDADGFIHQAGMQYSVKYDAIVPILTMASKRFHSQLNLIQRDLALSSTGEIILSGSTPSTYAVATPAGSVNRIAALADLAVARIRAGYIQTRELLAQRLTVTERLTAPDIRTEQLSSGDGEIELLGDLAVSEDLRVGGDLLVTDSLEVTGPTKLAALSATSIEADSATFQEATISGTLTVDRIKATSIEANLISGLQERLSEQINATLSEPTLLAQLFGSSTQQTEEYLAQIQAEMSAYLGQGGADEGDGSSETGGETPTLSTPNFGDDLTLMADTAFINTYFQVNQSAYIQNALKVGQALLLGDHTTLAANYFSFGDQFSIQPSGQGRLSLMADMLVLDESGLATINANLRVAGSVDVDADLAVRGTLLGNMISAADPDQNIRVQLAHADLDPLTGETIIKEQALEFVNETQTPVATVSATGDLALTGALRLSQAAAIDSSDPAATSSATLASNPSAGQAVLPAGQTQVVVASPLVEAGSMIYITPLNSTNNQVLYVKNKLTDSPFTPENEGQFTVAIDFPLGHDTTFNWWIVQTN